jgi:DNA (cytosine-5)-methyltransferase 1
LEIFSGAGGLAKGLELAGFEHSAFVEFNKDACATLRRNFDPAKVFEGDIRDFYFDLLSDIDVVAGGPPCQPFSLGGKHGAYDDARDMFPYAIRAIETLTPKAFVFENVRGLLRESFSEYFRYIILRLTFPDAHAALKTTWREHLASLQSINYDRYNGIKYRVKKTLVNAADYGVPQCRERVVIVGIRSDIDTVWQFPEATHSEKRLLWDKFVTGSYWDNHAVPKAHREACPKTLLPRINDLRNTFGFFQPELKPWLTVRDALKEVPDPRTKHGIPDHIFRDGARTYAGHTGSDLDSPAKTVKAGGHGVPGGENMIRFRDGTVRYFTVYEAKVIQAFPKDFVITGAWGEALRQIGNAVPVVLGKQIGRALFKKIRSEVTKPNWLQPQISQVACVQESAVPYRVRRSMRAPAIPNKINNKPAKKSNGHRKPKKKIGNNVPRPKRKKSID